MLKNFDKIPFYIMADADKVLCDGESMTGLGGRVTGSSVEVLETWQEMTEKEALMSIEEATEEDYRTALEGMGVEFNDEETTE
jgi:hypothetical protein